MLDVFRISPRRLGSFVTFPNTAVNGQKIVGLLFYYEKIYVKCIPTKLFRELMEEYKTKTILDLGNSRR